MLHKARGEPCQPLIPDVSHNLLASAGFAGCAHRHTSSLRSWPTIALSAVRQVGLGIRTTRVRLDRETSVHEMCFLTRDYPPLRGVQPADAPGYYSAVSASAVGTMLKKQLQKLVSQHSTLEYYQVSRILRPSCTVI